MHEELKPFGQQQAHAGTTTTRLCLDDLCIQTITGSKQAYETILSSWKNGKKKEKRGGKNNSNFFYLLEYKIIFRENVVGYYNLENDYCNLPVGNSLKRKSGL